MELLGFDVFHQSLVNKRVAQDGFTTNGIEIVME